MDLEPLSAISPLDGRYRRRVEALAPIVSEYGLMRNRVRVEVAWFAHLASLAEVEALPPPTSEQAAALQAVWRDFDIADAADIRRREAQTNHDVKAVEYFVKDAVRGIHGLAPHAEFVHFGCTSEDINNLAYALMLREARDAVLAPAMAKLLDALRELAAPLADAPMLARTHGQPASPTTIGKELGVFVARLSRQLAQFREAPVLGKMNGAVGNYNAHAVAYPHVDWPAACQAFVEGLGLGFNAHTTQIEPHDYIAELFHALARFNQVLLDFDRDAWGYIAIGYFKQRLAEGETGSSTMPHKVNPIDFENSEGNIGLANAVLGHLASKLAVSRWQRDLSDSTALRSVGTAFGYSLVAYDSARKGIGKLEADRAAMAGDLDDAWEVLAEPVQTVMRAHGADEPYEQLKRLTRGQRLDAAGYEALLGELDMPSDAQGALRELSPAQYTGYAAALARQALAPSVRVYEAAWPSKAETLRAIRRTVFVEEQAVPEDEEWDGQDETSRHFLAEDASGTAIGVARLLPTGQIGRMAVLPPWRRHGIGAKLLAAAVRAAQGGDHPRIFLDAQTHAVGFYQRAGFVASGPTFMEAGIEHQRMELKG